ncbi:hybrid sensor histidine kinase/response regulator [Desulfobacter latus]|uniref:histidine kinase n=1 Tax=Desulfobacter latus TaxID=2292 RepID=A0A850T2H1_9BACT|nr:PAS domain-containing sensor histidine kinase [Desulfobacter latus]NWH05913.1 PAS domain S-box protein [Desulfobacter latus]
MINDTKLFENIVEKSADGILVLDQKGTILYCNPEARRLLKNKDGKPEGKLFNFPVTSCGSTDLEIRSSTGDVLNIEMRVNQTVWENRHVYIASLRDISDRKKTENALEKSRLAWKKTFDAIDDSIAILDLDKRVLRVNKSAVKVFNKPLDEIVGRPCHELFGVYHGECADCSFKKTVEEKTSHIVEIKSADSQKIFRVNTLPMVDNQNHITGVVHITRDITEHKALGDQLRQAQKMESIGTLAGGIAHDFNNILSVIMGFTSLAMGNAKDNTDLQEDLEEVFQAAQRATDLVEQILAFSRRSETDLRPLKIRLVINEALKLLRSIIPTSIDFKIDLAKGLSPVMADPTQIHQIIMNLCTNAGHAMETAGGLLEVEMKQIEVGQNNSAQYHYLSPGQFIELRVCDTGSGIAPEHLDSIFDPYFTTKDLGEGTGLGLSVVHGIVKQYGGEIKVESQLGKGSCFSLYFPAVQTHAITPEQESEQCLPGGHGQILVVDDEPSITKMVSRMLSGNGYGITTENCSIEALNLLKKDPYAFDLVITDMTMPKITGDLLAQEISALRPELPVILMTGFSKQVSEKGGMPAGISALIMKPLSTPELLNTVSSLINPHD